MFNIIIISIISMLTYISQEMVYPIIPLYITSVLGATPTIVGLIEGISKSLASLVKFYSGYFADKYKNKKIMIFFAYLLTLSNKILLIFSTSWLGILLSKVTERFGKGVRNAPMDAIISESYPISKRGKAFGINRFFHKLGASIGIIIAFFLLSDIDDFSYKNIFLISIIPIVIAFILIFFIKEERFRGTTIIDFKSLDKNLKIFLFIAFLSALGNSSKSFLLLRAGDIGFSNSNVILLYLFASLASCLLAYPIGRICDKIEKKYVVGFAYLLFAIIYFGFGIVDEEEFVYILFILYGIYISLISIGVKSFVSELAPVDMKATVLGLNDCLVGFASLPAALFAGFIWEWLGPSYSFYFSSLLGLVSSLLVFFLIKIPYWKR